jgi:hypothetical protein
LYINYSNQDPLHSKNLEEGLNQENATKIEESETQLSEEEKRELSQSYQYNRTITGDWIITDFQEINNSFVTLNGSIYIKEHGKLVVKNSYLNITMDYNNQHRIVVGEFMSEDSSSLELHNVVFDTDGVWMQIAFQGNSKIIYDNVTPLYQNMPWHIADTNAEVIVTDSDFGLTIEGNSSLKAEDSLLFLEIMFRDNVGTYSLPIGVIEKQDFVFENGKDKVVIETSGCTFTEWGTTLDRNTDITFVDTVMTIGMNAGLETSTPEEPIVLTDLKAKKYDYFEVEYDTNHLTLINTDVVEWYPQVFGGTVLDISNSNLADLQWNGGDSVIIVRNCTASIAFAMQEVNYFIYDSVITGDITATDDSKIFLYNTEVRGRVIELENGQVFIDTQPCEQCIEILPGLNREIDIIQIEGNVGEETVLDSSIFNVSANNYTWIQKHADMNDLQYMSNHALIINGSNNKSSTVYANYPGIYRIILENDEAICEFEYKAIKSGKPLVKGINFVDLFGETGGEQFNIYPENPECFKKALDHAFSAPERAGVEWVGFVSGGFYSQVDPPVIQDDDHFLSNSDERFYSGFVQEAHSRGLKVIETFQDGPSVWFTPEQYAELAEKQQTSEWWESWYDEWKVFLLKRMEMAESFGVDAVILLMYSEKTLDPELVPDASDKWIDIIDSVREVYSGEVGLNFINLDERFNFSDYLDFVQITYFGGLYTSREGAIANQSSPTIEEIMTINDAMFEGVESYEFDLPIYVVLTIGSTDAQLVTEDPDNRSQVDFNEQVLYYEAFYTSLDKFDWVSGIFTERWDYWDEYRRFGDDFNTKYFDETHGASPRNKPAEDVVSLWNEIFQTP